MDSMVIEQRKWSRADVARLLISSTALTELKLEQALQIVRLLTPHRVAAGTVLIEEGVTSTGYMALVLHGEAVVANSVGDTEPVLLGQLGCGALFGELGILDGKPRSATVTAVTDMDIAVLDRPGLSRLIETVPAVACSLLAAIISRVAERLRATNLKVQTLSAVNTSLQQELEALKGK
jgi:CRP-like cAMP-binding protein